jgi:predicted ArsR family transcriptional regulator
MTAEDLTGPKRKLLERLKLRGPHTARALAQALGLTDVAVRQHLQALEEGAFVRQRRLAPEGRGRPSVEWSLAPSANRLFPDRHADLTVDLIRAARKAFGEDGLDRLIAERARTQTESYRRELERSRNSLGAKVEALARRRTAEGYMAEAVREKGGGYLLVERHCPICEAAKTCVGLCKAELQVFRGALGEGVLIERTQHLLSDSDRCAYRIRKA